MARRGRFGRSETGASDLSATISSLVRQQQEAEERVFMNAFYDGTEYNGKVPTMSDVISFYENIANLSGIERGTTDWTALEQRIGTANNFDIKRTYNSLIAEFNTTDGANYSELIDFVTGRAMTSTDQSDLNSYQTGVEDITSSFLKYQGEALSRGELTAKEYQRITLDALQVLEPGSKQYNSAIYDAYTYEWNSLATIWQNRVKAGKVSASQFEAWAKGFAERVAGSGIGKKTELYSSIFATIATYGTGGGGGGNNSPAAQRLNETISDFSTLLTLASGLTGVDLGKVELSDLSDPSSTTLKKMTNNPEAMLLLADYLDSNPGFTNPTLTRLNIQDGDDLRQWVNKSVKDGYGDAAVVAANGGTNNVDLWHGVFTTNGNATGMDEFAYASTKWAQNLKSAAGNDILISHYNNEWKSYLNGGKSIYGTLPDNLGTEGNVALYQAEVAAANSGVNAGQTLSGVVNDSDIDWSTLPGTEKNASDLVSGAALLNYDPKTGEYTVVGKPNATATTGALKQITFVKIGDQLVPFTITINGQEVVDDNDETIARVYQKPNGETLIVDARSGQVITGVELLEDGDKFKLGEGTAETGGKPPLIDTTPVIATTRANISFANKDIVASRDTRPDDIRNALAILDQVGTANSLSKSERDALQVELDALNTDANLIEAENIEMMSEPGDLNAKIRAAELRGNQNIVDAYTWFANNQDIVSFDKSGKPSLNYAALKEQEQAAQAGGITGAQGVGAQIGAGIGVVLGAPLGPVGMGALGTIGGLLGTALTTENKAMEFQAAVLKSRTQAEIERDRAIAARMPTSEGYLNRVNQASGGANTFFRNLTTPTPSASPYPVGSLATPKVVAPPSPRAIAPSKTPTAIALTPFNPADPEARRAVILGQQATAGGNISKERGR
jgi:hypothetical protein